MVIKRVSERNLSRSPATQPVFAVVVFVQAADYYSPAGTGVDEFVIFQVNAYVGGNSFLPAVMKENQISLAQIFLAYFVAVFGTLVIRVSFQFFVVHLFI